MAGHFTKAIRRAQESFRKLSEKLAKPNKKSGKLMVPGHKGRAFCQRCRVMHTINEHRFHGPGSHKRTHGE